MKYLFTGLVLFWSFLAFSQDSSSVSLRVQNSYFITGQPVFGIGVDISKSSSKSLNFMVEYGKYASTQKDLLSANVETYSLRGFSIGSEFRTYQPFSDTPKNTGGFLGLFTSFKRLNESNTSGVTVDAGSLELNNVETSESIAYTNTTGLTAGWRLGNPGKKLMLEGSFGYGYQVVHWAKSATFSSVDPTMLSNAWVSRIEMAFLIRL